MKDSFIIELIQNVALLITFSMIYDYFWARDDIKRSFAFKVVSGLFLGGLGIALILTPYTFQQGLVFDTRSVLLSISGLFLGPIPTIVAMIIVGGYRIMLGGYGIYMGLAVVLTSGTIGILWSYVRPNWKMKNHFLELLYLSITVHLVMLACTLLLPVEVRFETFTNILLPVLFLYPIAGVLLGLLMLKQRKVWENKKALDISEERWHFALEGAGDGVWDWNVENNEVFYSKRWKNMLGYEEYEIENKFEVWKELLFWEDKEAVFKNLNDFLNCTDGLYQSEYRLRRKDGSYAWILSRGKAMSRDANGRPIRCIGTHKDITDRKNTEEALIKSEQYTKSILSSIPDLIFVFDNNGVYLDYKSGNKNNLAVPFEKFINKTVFDVLPNHVATLIKNGIDFVFVNDEATQVEYVLELNDESCFFECHITPFDTSKVVALVRNITDRRKIEIMLRNSEEQLKSFASHLQSVREEERAMLAREIHDDLTQTLVAIKIELGMLSQKTAKYLQEGGAVDEFSLKLNKLVGMVDGTIKTSRRIMSGLRSDVLELLGFVDALKLHINSFQEQYDVCCTFVNEVKDLNLDHDHSLVLFRIVQESFVNIAKHACATDVKVKLIVVDGKLILEICDNGVGFDTSAPVSNESYGLIGLKERAILLNANVEIISVLSEGTTVRVSMVL